MNKNEEQNRDMDNDRDRDSLKMTNESMTEHARHLPSGCSSSTTLKLTRKERERWSFMNITLWPSCLITNKSLTFLFTHPNLFSITISLLYGLSRYSADFLRRPLTHLSVPDLAFPGRTSPGTVRRQPGWKRRKHPRLQEQEG